MKEHLYLIDNGMFLRESNTIFFVGEKLRYRIPINRISAISCFGKASMSSMIVSLFCKKNIPVHLFSKYGKYEGSFMPAEWTYSGKVLIQQAEYYLNKEKRMYLCEAFVNGCKNSMLEVIRDYKIRKEFLSELKNTTFAGGDENQLRSYEGRLWQIFYRFLGANIRNFTFIRRKPNPPEDEINALISFGNALLYGTVLTEIYNTQLNPQISFLHTPMDKRNSLVLDIADIFKPIIVGRLTLKMGNFLKKEHFENIIKHKEKGIFLNQKGRKIFVSEYDKRIKTIIYVPQLKRDASLRAIIRNECYKLIRHLKGEFIYNVFEPW
ncbi:MAG: subtype I-B CRISPR-associated endonuclease Cas1 [Candidatus Aenigmarchaeota archaeon ex4484_52]|nr:MAG: subtype I-B CRISPR-associated endonuclease Cas1 [Candidatus Aenigmarchaeota archaeon ex4484_52]